MKIVLFVSDIAIFFNLQRLADADPLHQPKNHPTSPKW
jgi:hypothetical protein